MQIPDETVHAWLTRKDLRWTNPISGNVDGVFVHGLGLVGAGKAPDELALVI